LGFDNEIIIYVTILFTTALSLLTIVDAPETGVRDEYLTNKNDKKMKKEKHLMSSILKHTYPNQA